MKKRLLGIGLVTSLSLLLVISCNTGSGGSGTGGTGSGGSGGGSSGPLITQDSVVGKWELDFQWQGRTPGVYKLVNLQDQWFVAPGGQPGDDTYTDIGTTSVSGNQLTWGPWPDGSVWSGTATSSASVSGTMVSSAGNTGTFTATETTTPFITNASVLGTWLANFQWPGRTQGWIYYYINSDGTVKVPGGQPGDNSTDTFGTWSIKGNLFACVLGDGSSWNVVAVSSTSGWGEMVNSTSRGIFFPVYQTATDTPIPGK